MVPEQPCYAVIYIMNVLTFMTFTKSGRLKEPLNFHNNVNWTILMLAILAVIEPLKYKILYLLLNQQN